MQTSGTQLKKRQRNVNNELYLRVKKNIGQVTMGSEVRKK
jgi:hypothetical protein